VAGSNATTRLNPRRQPARDPTAIRANVIRDYTLLGIEDRLEMRAIVKAGEARHRPSTG
jgi:hypothetical protein